MDANFEKVVMVLLIAGALNWGSVAYNGKDYVTEFLPNQEKYVKYAVAAAGVYALYQFMQ